MKKIFAIIIFFIVAILLYIPGNCNASTTEVIYKMTVLEEEIKIKDVEIQIEKISGSSEKVTILEKEKADLQEQLNKLIELDKQEQIGDLWYRVLSEENKTVEVRSRHVDVSENGLGYGGYKENANTITEIIIPSKVTINNKEYTVSAIGSYAFINHKNLESIIIPDSITYIGRNAFTQCLSLKNIDLPNTITSIEEHTFSSSGLQNITIPNSVKYINIYAFAGCANLTNIIIPKSVERIATTAFDSSNKVVINTYKGSVAETFAKGVAIPVVLLDDEILQNKLGDINKDGKINTKDAREVLLAYIGKKELTAEQKELGDVNKDGKINTKDARQILLYYIGKIKKL